MPGFRMLLVLLLIALPIALANEKINNRTKINRSPKTVIPQPEDAEYLKVDASDNSNNKNNNEKEAKSSSDEEKPKTLSQQIADGKYGLIHNELFSKTPKRPGVISYDSNPEVPNDNINNLGGLDKNEIWLAENHLLVIKGGGFPPYDEKRIHDDSPWAPLDNYKAPLHQVKIPKNPKVPPPFPVQLTEDGPLQILGTNSSRTVNGTYEEALNAISPPEGYPPFAPPFIAQPYDTDKTNITSRPAALPIPFNNPGEFPEGVPFPPSFLNGTLPPSLSYLPPGTVVLPPPGNQTDYPDYDDPSIYYPPPYSFFYPKYNKSLVPPGPLVPGIVLPPPPNFFAPLENDSRTSKPTTTTTTTTRKPIRYRKPTTTTQKSTSSIPTTKKPTFAQKTVKIYPVKNHQYIKEVKPITTTSAPLRPINVLPEVYTVPHRQVNYKPVQRKKPGITILKPVTPQKSFAYENNEIPNQPFKVYGPPELNNKITITTTQVPLRYQTTSNDIETNSVSEENEQENPRRGKFIRTTSKPVQIYFYEEQNKETRTPKQNTYVDHNEPYYVRPRPINPVRQKRPQYVYVTARPYNTQKPRFRFIQQTVNPDTFGIHISKLKNQIQKYYTTPRNIYRTVPKPVYQFSFEANNFSQQQHNLRSSSEIKQQNQYQPIPAKYTVEIQQAIEIIPTESPQYEANERPVYYQPTTERPYYSTPAPAVTPKLNYRNNVATPRPISEYSFEATPNPIYQGYYTKPDEHYFDDRTKTYFNMFGRKIPSGTTPIPPHEQRPISLEGDTIVNYVNPRPNVNSEAEVIHVKDPPSYSNIVRYPPRNNENNPEIIKAIPIEVPSKESQDGSFISYQLPGDDGAHFYFLTPQLAQRRDQGVGFYYSKTRRRRNEKTIDR